MQPLRKSSAHEQDSLGVDPASVSPQHRDGPRPAEDHAAALSPALALREHLTARLEELGRNGAGDTAILAEPGVAKLPVPARIAVIVGMSVSLWLALYLAVTATL